MVDPEKLGQLLRFRAPPLHAVEERELAVQQRLAAPRQAQEHVAHAASQLGLLDRHAYGGLLDHVERLADLADLVPTELERWGFMVDIDLLTTLKTLNDAG